MRKVRNLPKMKLKFVTLTEGKVYDVISYTEMYNIKYVHILDDDGIRNFYPVYRGGNIEFEDITAELRTKVIDEILS